MPQILFPNLIKPNSFFKVGDYLFDDVFNLYIKKCPNKINYLILHPKYANLDLSTLEFDPLSYFDEILLRDTNLKIIFDCSGEVSHIDFPYFRNFLKSYKARNLNFSNFYYLTADAIEKQVHKNTSNVYYINVVDSYFNKNNCKIINSDKKYHFSCLTRKPRYWRSKLIYLIQKNNNLKSKSLCSHPKINDSNPISDHTGFDVEDQMLDFFINSPALQVSTDKPLQENMHFNDIMSHLPEVYSQICFDVCMEAYQEGPHQAISEKTLKPMVNLVPTIIWGTPGINTVLLSQLGFKTYEDWFDLSFDNELDTEKRLQMLFLEINRVCSMLDNMSINERIQWQNKNIQILNHNRNLVLNSLPINVSEVNRLYKDLHTA